MDISEFAGKDVVFRVQTRYDDDLSLTEMVYSLMILEYIKNLVEAIHLQQD